MMRFAVMGGDRAAVAVAEAVARNPRCRLTHWAPVSSQQTDVPVSLNSIPQLRIANSWEELHSDPEIDAVIVADSGETAEGIVRQLLQTGKSVLVVPRLMQSVAFFYELALIDAENPGKLFPLLEWRGAPLVCRLREIIEKKSMGQIRHVQFERVVTAQFPAGESTLGLIDHAELTSALLVDVDLLRALFGSYDQVSAVRAGDRAEGYSQATVTFSGGAAPQAIWSVKGGIASSFRLTVFGETGSAVLERNAATPSNAADGIRLTLTCADQPVQQLNERGDLGGWLLSRFLDQAVPADELSLSERDGRQVKLWDELAIAVELVDAVERSVRRRRTIDVHFETPSERGLFKSQMTAVGCSLLMLTLVAAVLYLVFEASFELPRILRQILVVLIFVPLGIFIALQLLYFVARPSSREKK